MNTQTFTITGMDCAACARTIETGVGKLAGVESCAVSLTAARLRVEGTASDETIRARVQALGYDAKPLVAAESSTQPTGVTNEAAGEGQTGFLRYLTQRRETQFALLGALLALPGVVTHELMPLVGMQPEVRWVDWASILALLLAGWPVMRSAWRAVTINRELNINVLMTLAALGAIVIGAYSEAALVMVLFAIGEAMEGFSMARARQSIHSLLQVAPNTATVLRPCIDCQGHMGQDGYTGGPCPFCGIEESLVAVEQLAIGERVLVKPGERIPVDGIVLAGASAVNQAPITGESIPLDKLEGSEVYAGSINGEGVLEITVLKVAADSTISRMIQLVEAAETERAPTQKFIDRFAQVYTPVVTLLALLVAILPPLLWTQPFWGDQGWLYRALALLVVACPCALVISTPVSLISAISNAARKGVLIKGSAYVEALSRVKAIALDKTGTLTAGKPSVLQVQAIHCAGHAQDVPSCDLCDDLLARATALERRSEHPMARAVVQAAEARGLLNFYTPAEGVSALVGKGIRGTVNGAEVLIGSHAMFDQVMFDQAMFDQTQEQTQLYTLAHTPAQCQELTSFAHQGETPLLVGVGNDYAGYIRVSDTLHQDSRSVVEALKVAGIKALVMLTGDTLPTAQAIAQQAGISDVRANLLPADKLKAIKALLQEYDTVAMVGDGINDAPALALASVGIAMGAGGTAQAAEAADMVLMSDGLSQLPFAYKLCQAAMRTVTVNVVFSIGIKLLFFVLVLLGWGSMWLAVLADVGTSLLVTANGMRLLQWSDE